MKIKKLLLTMALCCFCVFSVVGLAGCKDVTLSLLKENFEKLDAAYAANSDVFVEGEFEGLPTKYLISSYGTVVDKRIENGTEGYEELLKLYNATLVMASDYVDSNREFLLALEEKELSKQSKEALKILNDSVVEYTNSIEDFIRGRASLMDYFSKYAEESEVSNMKNILQFKKIYGNMVKKNVRLATNSARMVETTKIFELLKQTHPTAADTETVKEYIRAKLLPIYSEMKITEIANNMNWSAQKEGDCKPQIDAVIEKLDASFVDFKQNFVTKKTSKVLTKTEMGHLFDIAEEFFVEAEAYFQALYGLSLSKLAVSYDNQMSKYLKENALAEVYLQKLEQFVGHSLGQFMDAVCDIIYA